MTRLRDAKRLVLKIGSSLLVDDQQLRRDWLRHLAQDLAVFRGRGQELIIVSSGAIALGRRSLGLSEGNLRLEEKQAAAAAGQVVLAHGYREALAEMGMPTAQMLLTLDDTEDRRRYLNARATTETLLSHGAVPVVNENDTVATSEIRYGDNDRLSARVAVMAGADLLILLSDVDGLYSADPRRDPSAPHWPHIAAITPEIEAMAGGSGSDVGTGGMVSKLAAAKIATSAGCAVILAKGAEPKPLERLDNGERHSLFEPTGTWRNARKDWIAGGLRAKGSLVIDQGAVRALQDGSSLLPAGVKGVSGDFQRGDVVIIQSADGNMLAKGLSAYGAAEARLIIGRHTDEIEQILGFRGRHEVIHRDDLVLI